MRDRIIRGSTFTDLHKQWDRRGDPGGLDRLHEMLRDHLVGLEEWRFCGIEGGR